MKLKQIVNRKDWIFFLSLPIAMLFSLYTCPWRNIKKYKDELSQTLINFKIKPEINKKKPNKYIYSKQYLI